ncbi:MAG: hypothetical protein AAF798_04525 [Bacteroidota bacterium]
MNIVKATHQLAMDTNALAELSKAKGLEEDATNFYRQAYELEKKAALMTSSTDEDPIAHFILLRSAAALAYKSKLYRDSQRLIEICLSGNPPVSIHEDLNELSKLLQRAEDQSTISTIDNALEIEGLLTRVNAEENEITIKAKNDTQKYAVIVPKHQLKEIIQSHWYKQVLVTVRQTTFGVMVLERIKTAA